MTILVSICTFIAVATARAKYALLCSLGQLGCGTEVCIQVVDDHSGVIVVMETSGDHSERWLW